MSGLDTLLLLALAAQPATSPDFTKDIQPILQANCIRCHGGERTRAELDLRSRAGMIKGGESGPALSPGSAEKSLLWIHIAANRMPPGKEKLTAAQKTTLRGWIESGARGKDAPTPPPPPALTDADRAFWSFRPPVRPPLPILREGSVANPIDVFLLASLQKKGLTFSPPADRRALLRRVTFDLTGLPPTPEETDAFVSDPRPDAYVRAVDRLLASPRYGERWGRHWLDVAGYADSEGILDADYVRSMAWRYRDYVIAALNADKPYNRFLQEQIAGDELTDYWTAFAKEKALPAEVTEGLLATGFLRCAADTSRPDFANIKNAPGYYYQTLDDTLKIVTTAAMGLTLHCAKCHSHKFDPIPHSDYYRMQAIFMSGYRPSQWVPQVQRKLDEATAGEQTVVNAQNAKVTAELAEVVKLRAALQTAFAGRLLEDGLKALPEPIREDVRQAVQTPAAKRTEVQKYLARKFEAQLKPAGNPLLATLRKTYPEFVKQERALTAKAAEITTRKITFREIRAFYDLPGSVPTRLLRRGDYLNPGAEVQPGVLAMLTTPEPFRWNVPAADAKTSGRRLAFAKWLTQPGHPLTARVMVNRLWMHHFGEGLVSTPENFGRSGSAPSHPELLDWLAVDFAESGWSLKRLHRLMVLSSAYQQSSVLDEKRHAVAVKSDPDNRLLWRQRLRRLDAESLRDAILASSGNLSPSMFGSPVPMVRRGDGEVVTPEGEPGSRRSVYLQVRRSQPLTLLQVFDQPVMETNCTRRMTSTVSSQALALLNSDFLTAQGETFAQRVLREGGDPTVTAVRIAFGRPVREREKGVLADFLAKQAARYGGTDSGRHRALADLCQMLLSSNEFAYVD